MGAVNSRLLRSWVWRAGGQPGAPGEENEEEGEERVAPGVVEGEQDGEEAGPSTSQGGLKRKRGAGGPSEKGLPQKRNRAGAESAYEALFVRGEDSDVQICALGATWHLHRAYLCQAHYFGAMFSGAWRESNMSTIEMQMPDDNIDREAFHNVLGFLYQDAMFITPNRVIPTLATASLLQVEEIIQQCGEIMRDTLCNRTVCRYYHSADSYGLPTVRTMCFEWLLDNLMTQSDEDLLREISPALMKEVIASAELVAMEVEMDVYNKLKKWMFLQLHPTWSGSYRTLLLEVNLWLARYNRESPDSPFLETQQGRPFMPVFQQLRLAYIISDLSCARTIDQDALIPAAWINPVYKQQWLTLLRAEQTRKSQPVDIKVFNLQEKSMRCGAQIRRDETCHWRWAGFNFGWDLLVSYSDRRIVFGRSVLSKCAVLGVSHLWHKKIAFRLRLTSLDKAGRAMIRIDTEYQMLALRKDQVLEVANLQNQELTFPVYVACNFLYVRRNGHCPY